MYVSRGASFWLISSFQQQQQGYYPPQQQQSYPIYAGTVSSTHGQMPQPQYAPYSGANYGASPVVPGAPSSAPHTASVLSTIPALPSAHASTPAATASKPRSATEQAPAASVLVQEPAGFHQQAPAPYSHVNSTYQVIVKLISYFCLCYFISAPSLISVLFLQLSFVYSWYVPFLIIAAAAAAKLLLAA